MARRHPFRNTYMSNHHTIPKSIERKKIPKNEKCYLIKIWRDKHDAFHILYHNLTLNEIIVFISLELKGKRTCLRQWHKPSAHKVLWKEKNYSQILLILKTLRRWKRFMESNR